MQWFPNNQMKANADKCHLLTSSNKESTICIDNNIIINSKCEKLLKIDKKLTLMLILMTYSQNQGKN